MNSEMALKEFCTITNIGSEIFIRLRGEKTLGSGGKIIKNYLSMEFRMIDERNIKWLSLDNILKQDLKSGFISKIDDLNLYIELLRKNLQLIYL